MRSRNCEVEELASTEAEGRCSISLDMFDKMCKLSVISCFVFVFEFVFF